MADVPMSLTDLLPEPATRVFLDCLSSVLDQYTFARLAQAGIVAGGRCLVMGAGNDHIAEWLVDAVGASGQITTIDSVDELPDSEFDLIYGRLTLAHAPEPNEALADLAELLAPGGVLVIEEWAWSSIVLTARDPDASTLFARYKHALVTLLAGQGTDVIWAENVPAAMLDAGLVGVDVAAHARSWPGGTPGTKLHVVVITELRDRLGAAGVRSDDLDRLRDLLADPDLLLLGNLSISTIGRRARATLLTKKARTS